MSEINATVVVEPISLTVQPTTNTIDMTVDATNIGIYTTSPSSPGGNAGELQYNFLGTTFQGIPTVTYDGSNITLGNNDQVKITGGTNGYFLQTDGSGNLVWTAGTANVSGNGTAAGSNGAVQFSDGTGNFLSDSGFNYNNSNNSLSTHGLETTYFTWNDPNDHIALGKNSTANTNSATAYGSGADAEAFGVAVGSASYAGGNGTSIGTLSGARGTESVSLGYYAGNQSGPQLRQIALGGWAGRNCAGTDEGHYSIAIGHNSGNSQGINCIAIGQGAGDQQSSNSIAFGSFANAGSNATAIGYGAYASDNTLVLKQSLNTLTLTSNGLAIDTIPQQTTANVLFYDPVTGNISYDTTSGPPSPAAGADTEIQFNTSGVLDASANLTFDNANSKLFVNNFETGNITALGHTLCNTISWSGYANGNIDGSANTANTATTSSTVTTNAQPNITSVGTLTSLAITGDLTSTNGNVSLTNGNIEAFDLTANNNVQMNNGNIQNQLTVGGNVFLTNNNRYLQMNPVNYSALPSASTVPGARAMINDYSTSPPVFGTIVSAGGSGNFAPVWSDGSVWRIG